MTDDTRERWGRWYNADEIDKLVRRLDVALNGSKAAPAAKLCDLVAQAESSPTAPAQPGEGEVEEAIKAIEEAGYAKKWTLENRQGVATFPCWAVYILLREALLHPSPSARQGEPSDETVEKMARALIVHLMKDESANGLVVPVGINWRAAMRAALAAWGEGEK